MSSSTTLSATDLVIHEQAFNTETPKIWRNSYIHLNKNNPDNWTRSMLDISKEKSTSVTANGTQSVGNLKYLRVIIVAVIVW